MVGLAFIALIASTLGALRVFGRRPSVQARFAPLYDAIENIAEISRPSTVTDLLGKVDAIAGGISSAVNAALAATPSWDIELKDESLAYLVSRWKADTDDLEDWAADLAGVVGNTPAEDLGFVLHDCSQFIDVSGWPGVVPGDGSQADWEWEGDAQEYAQAFIEDMASDGNYGAIAVYMGRLFYHRES